MKKAILLSAFAFIAIQVFTSCNGTIGIVKRKHNPGYYVSITNNVSHVGNKNNSLAEDKQQYDILKEVLEEKSKVQNIYQELPLTVSITNLVNKPNSAHLIKSSKIIKELKKHTVFDEIKVASITKSKPVKVKSKTVSPKKEGKQGEPSKGLLILLCFLVPWLAVGLVTDWDANTVIYNILWTLLCGLPGIIHAIIVVNREYR